MGIDTEMKRSTKVALTLLVPAMAAYGCGNQSKTSQFPAPTQRLGSETSTRTRVVACQNGHSFPVDNSRAGQTVRCPECDAPVSVPAATSPPVTRPYRSRGWGTWWLGDSRTRPDTYIPTPAPPDRYASTTSDVSRGGFGRTGSLFSGGS